MTPQEAKLWIRLRALWPQGLHFHRQVPIEGYVVDFACLKEWLIVEVDGGQHNHDRGAARDAARDAKLSSLGFRILRSWNAEVDADPASVVETILARIEGR